MRIGWEVSAANTCHLEPVAKGRQRPTHNHTAIFVAVEAPLLLELDIKRYSNTINLTLLSAIRVRRLMTVSPYVCRQSRGKSSPYPARQHLGVVNGVQGLLVQTVEASYAR